MYCVFDCYYDDSKKTVDDFDKMFWMNNCLDKEGTILSCSGKYLPHPREAVRQHNFPGEGRRFWGVYIGAKT